MKLFFATAAVVLGLLAAPAAQEGAEAVAGDWELTTLSPLGESTTNVTITKEGDGIKAVAKGAQGERAYDSAAIKGKDITLVITIDFEGSPMVITYNGTVSEGAAINGSADFGGLAEGSFTAKRKPKEEAK
jgi:hypothetical protein